ncbi:MAG TPA: hypothetical protein VHD83_08170 [Puia sp.]|nr:hypothetical protein [Puia sp.]
MAAVRTYRRCFAAFLLGLYAFIATPVQLWHHHDQQKNSRGPEKYATYHVGGGHFDAACKICSHKYSICDGAAPLSPAHHVAGYQAYSSWDTKQPLSRFSTSFFNKGPPALG